MAGKLFNIYSGNTGGVLSTSTAKVGSFGTTSDDFYSVNFDTGRKSIWTNNIEFGRAADWGNISDIPSWIGSDGVTWANVKDKPATATRWPYWSEILSKPTAIGSVTQPIYWDGSTFQLVNSVAPATHDHDDKYLKLTGGTLSGDLAFSHGSSTTDQHITWASGTNYQRLKVRDGQTDVFIFQYSTDSGTTWSDYFTIQNGTAKIGTYTVYHSGNLPAYPTVNDGTLNLQASGTTKVTFTANQSGTSNFNIATGSADGTISVGGTDVAVKGLGSNAYTSTDYLPLTGGQMTGNITWKNSTALPEQSSPQYFLVIDAFTDGGATKWASKANTLNALTGLTSTAKGTTSKPIYWDGTKFVECLAYSQASVNYANSAGSVDWGNVQNKPSTFTPSAHDHTRILYIDDRDTVETPTDVAGKNGIEIHFKNKSKSGITSDGTWTAVIMLDGYSDVSGGYPMELGFSMSDLSDSRPLYLRTPKSSTEWGDWRTILDSKTYTDFTVKKDGTGATGSWNINTATATKLQTARTITINGSSKTFDGSGNISWSLADLNLPSNDHNHDDRYLKLSGGTMTGVLHLLASQYADTAGTGALDLANSDIYGVNSIKFADLADSAGEGLQWYRDATHVDSIWVKNGVIYFTPNRTWSGTGTDYTVYHSGNLTAATLLGSTAKGNSTKPIYWDGSKLVECLAYSQASVNYANTAGDADNVRWFVNGTAFDIAETNKWYRIAYWKSNGQIRNAVSFYVKNTGGSGDAFLTKFSFDSNWSRAHAHWINIEGLINYVDGLCLSYDSEYIYINLHFKQTNLKNYYLYVPLNSTAPITGNEMFTWLSGTLPEMTGTVESSYIAHGNTGFNSNAYISGAGFYKTNSSNSYVLLGGGGHKEESSLSVNYATSAGSADYATSAGEADTLDTFHAVDLFQTFTNDATNNAVKIKIGNTEKSLVVGYATKAGDADKLDNIDSTGFLRYISHNAEWSATANTPTNLTAGIHKIHVSGVEYSSILTGYDYNGSYWQLWFHPSSGYSENILYRATNCSSWKTILDSNNSSVSKSGETLSVKINGTTQSLTNTWRGITDSYNVDSPSSSTSLSQKGAKALYNALINGYANEAGNADTVDNKHAEDFIYRLRRSNNNVTSQPNNGMIPPAILEFLSAGYPVYTDPEFASDNNSCSIYNNQGNGTVTINRIADNQGSGNSSGYILKIVTNGTASPGAGGFVQTISSRANAIFIQVFRAKVPVGYNVVNAENAQGDNATITWLTDRAGTGKWEWYARLVYCGNTGSFSNGGHVYLSGTSNTSVTWYLSHITLVDITKGNYNGLRTRYADHATSSDSASSVAWANITDKAVSKTAWGQTFVDASGNIQSISGNMTSVGQVTPDGNATRDNGTSSANWASVYTRSIISGDHLTLRSGTSKDIIFQTNAGTEYMRLTSGGNLGINCTDPGARVEIAGRSNTLLGINTSTYLIGHTRKDLHFTLNNGSGSGVNDGYMSAITFGDGKTSSYAGIYVQSSGSYGTRIIFGTTNSYSAGTYGRMIITHTGAVGIGTMSPGQKLQVTGGNILQEGNNSWLTPARLQIGRPDTSVYTDRSCIGTTDGNLHLDPYSGKELYLNYYSNTGAIRFFQNLAHMSTNGHLYVPGYHFKGNDDNNYVLTAGGSYKQWSESKVASTIVARTANNYIYNGYYNSDISDEDSLTPGSVYFAQSNEGWIRKQSIGKFADNLRSEEIISIDKSLTVTEAWMDTGIIMNTDTFPRGTGTYAIQITSNTAGTDGWYPYFSGILTIYTSTTNGTLPDEVPLHCIGHSNNGDARRIYIRTIEGDGNTNGKIQIAGATTLSAHTYTFKFRKLI